MLTTRARRLTSRLVVIQRATARHRCGVGQISIEDAYRKWCDDLVGYASALVGPSHAADLVTETFARVLARGPDEWERVAEPRRYLFRAVLNQARQLVRGTTRREQREQRWLAQSTAVELLIDPTVVRVLDGLSVRQRAATYLTYWEDLDAPTVAGLLGISPGAVKRHLARARRALKPVLEVSDV